MTFKQLKVQSTQKIIKHRQGLFQKSREGVGPGDTEKDLRIYKFEGIYPNVVSSIPLDFGATDQIEEFQVTFNYLFWEVVGGTTDYGGSLNEES